MPPGNAETVKGRVKEAVGALTGDRLLKNRGRAEQAKGSVKKAAYKVQVRAGRRPARGR